MITLQKIPINLVNLELFVSFIESISMRKGSKLFLHYCNIGAISLLYLRNLKDNIQQLKDDIFRAENHKRFS